MDASLYCGQPWQRQHPLYALQSLHVPPGEHACILVHSSGATHLENNCTIQGLTCIGRSDNNVGSEVKQGCSLLCGRLSFIASYCLEDRATMSSRYGCKPRNKAPLNIYLGCLMCRHPYLFIRTPLFYHN